MRPLRLEIRGFSTFLESTVVDLEGLDLVAFTGQTGSGKSSLIDAMTFALYGSVARYGKEKQVAPAIHSLASEAKVRLDFEVSQKRYVAVRVLRRKISKDPDAASSASTKEARLEDVETGQVIAGNVKELNLKVVELLGLDFNQFTRTIVLPQGAFADFLNDEPANRQKLLRRLLDMEIYAKMGKAARAESKKANQQASVLVAEQERNPAPTDEQLVALEAKHAALLEAHPTVSAALIGLEAVVDRRQKLLEEHKAAAEAMSRLSAVEVPAEIMEADQQLRDRSKDHLKAKALLSEAQDTLKQSAAGGSGILADLGLTIDRLQRLTVVRSAASDLEVDEPELVKNLELLDAEGAELEQNRAELQATYEAAQTTASAADWLTSLSIGDPCPLCRQTVDLIPDHDPDHELSLAKTALADANEQYKGWEKKRSDMAAALNERRRSVKTQLQARTELEALLADDPSVPSGGYADDKVIGEQIDELTVKRNAAMESAESATLAQSHVDSAQDQVAKAEALVLQAQSQIRQHNLAFSATRDTLADLEPPPVVDDSTIENWQTLADWAEGKVRSFEARVNQIVDDGQKVADELRLEQASLSKAAEQLGLLFDKGSPAQLLDALLVATTKTQSEIDQARRHRDEAQDRQTRIDGLGQEAELNKVLGSHLDASGFEGWLLNEALDNIVTKATDRLLQLSAGQYSLLVTDRHFAIIDHNNADERRDVRTLSGGETFLASLALALALADSIAELAPIDAPRLESMFLDEGFGTLDPETLDVVASAIEELAADGRMIGIVTHVRDLAERLPVRFEVTKGPTSSTVELVEL